MKSKHPVAPEHTAVRVALWRSLHLQLDQQPYVFFDDIGEKIVGESGWQNRPDMNPDFSKPMRASIVGRARLVEDLIEEEVKKGVSQIVILGAGLDTFAQRRLDLATKLQIFEIDQPGPQQWKKNRLAELNYDLPSWLHFVAVDFESGESWWDKLIEAGFDVKKSAVVISTGVSMYLSKEVNLATFKQLSQMGTGSTFATTFMLALDLLQDAERASMEFVMQRAKESGTPFVSLFHPEEIVEMAQYAGFKTAQYIAATDIYQKYFASRTDGLRAGDVEAFLVART